MLDLILDIFSSEMCTGCLVCVICNSFHLFIFKFCIMIVIPIEDVHFLFCAHLINICSFFTGVELRHLFPSEMHRGCLVCVIYNSYFVHISRFFFHFGGLERRHFFL